MLAGYCPICISGAAGAAARFCPRCGRARVRPLAAVVLADPGALARKLLVFIACHSAMALMALAYCLFLPQGGASIACHLGMMWLIAMVPASAKAIREMRRTATRIEIGGTLRYRRFFALRSVTWTEARAIVFSSRRTRGPRSRQLEVCFSGERFAVIDCTPAQEESVRQVAAAYGYADRVSSR